MQALPAARSMRLACAALAVLAAGAASAQAVGLSAQQVGFEGPSQAAGTLGMLHLAGPASGLELTLFGARVEAYQHNSTQTEVHVLDVAVEDENSARLMGGPTGSQSWSGVGATAEAVDARPEATVHVYDATSYLANVGKATWSTIEDPFMDRLGIRSAYLGADGQQPASSFRRVSLEGDFPRAVASSGKMAFTVAGTFIVEAEGLDIALSSPSDSTVFHSGRTTQAVAGPPWQPTVTRTDVQLVRILVKDGSMTISVGGPAMEASWVEAGKATVTSDEASAALDGAVGVLQRPGPDLLPDDGRLVVPAPFTLELAPQGERLAVRHPAPSGVVAAGASPSPTLGLAVAAAALVGAVAVALVAARATRPTLRHVERALERGRYTTAAALAARVLRRDPRQEDAAIARAVALSKAGQQALVIQEVGARVRSRPPTDGVLHYVLGLAYLDAGQRAHAQAAMAEAVRLTPSLAADVAARLPPSTGTERHREASAYA